MPKRLLLIAVAAIGLGLAACNSGGSTSTNPTAGPSSTPDPNITATTVQVTLLGTPVPKAPVLESTPESSSSPQPGTPFAQATTNASGEVVFSKLKPGQIYCWVSTPPGTVATFSACTSDWQYANVDLGT
jgi:hypothetical protein